MTGSSGVLHIFLYSRKLDDRNKMLGRKSTLATLKIHDSGITGTRNFLSVALPHKVSHLCEDLILGGKMPRKCNKCILVVH